MQKHKKTRVSGTAGRTAIAASVLLTFTPLAASASAPDAGTVGIDAAATAAVIEMVPVAPSAEISVPAPASAPVEAKPAADRARVLGRGSASYYAAKFHGRRTASGEAFNNRAYTGAHRTLPFGTRVRVTNPANGASVVVRINDRGHATVELAVIEG